MSRVLPVLLLGLAIMSVPAFVQPLPPGMPADPRPAPEAHPSEKLYPLEAGLRWAYGPLVVREITGRHDFGGHTFFDMTFRLPIGTYVIPMRHAAEGVVTHREGREHLLLRFPMRKGDRWRIDLPGEADVADCEVLDQETIPYLDREGPATKLKVTRTNRKSNRVTTDYEWYVDGVGLVKMQVTLGLRATFTLKQFDRVAK